VNGLDCATINQKVRASSIRKRTFDMASYLYLISYILDNQPGTCELRSDQEDLSREAARDYLQGLHRNEASSFTDVQVQRLEHDHERGTSPGHYQQP